MWGSKRKLYVIVIMLLGLLALPSVALAHDGSGTGASLVAGPISWGFLIFAVVVIAAVSLILFVGKRGDDDSTAEQFEGLTGFRGYIGKMRLFSRNARLYMIHVVGMDVIYGTWEVVFNLYLLALGFDVAFVGLRLMLRAISAAVMSIPAGVISDRIGRKLSFILGDGTGAIVSLIAISTGNKPLLLITAVIGGMFGSLHGVSEPAFMAENSRDFERVHLFSVASGTRTAAAIIGSALAGLATLLLANADPAGLVRLYRTVAYGGIGIWLLSLIPALLLRQTKPAAASTSLRDLFGNVKHPDRIFQLSLPGALLGLGAGMVLPLMNVYFQEGLGTSELEIGATFSAGQGLLVIAAFLAPLLAAWLGKVRSVVVTQFVSVPFIVLLAFAPEAGNVMGSVLAVAGLAYILRVSTMNMAGPVRSAFAMEILDPGERGTQVGVENAASLGLSGAASFIGASLMDTGDFRTPFLIMAAMYLISTALFWYFFRKPMEAPQMQAVAAQQASGD